MHHRQAYVDLVADVVCAAGRLLYRKAERELYREDVPDTWAGHEQSSDQMSVGLHQRT